MSRLRLVINADDFGYSQERDEGIVQCIQSRLVTSCSLLPNGLTAKTAAASVISLASDFDVSLGLHLNLTEGRPIGSTYDSLLDSNGEFLDKITFRQTALEGRIDFREVREEIDKQIGTFEKICGTRPCHVDGHQHVHVITGVCEALAQAMSEKNIDVVRIPVEKDIEKGAWLEKDLLEFFKNVIQDSLAAKSVFQKYGIFFTDSFLGLTTMGKHMTIQRLQDHLKPLTSTLTSQVWLKSPPTCELMVHPGYRTRLIGGCGATGPDDFSQSVDREHEMDMLSQMTSSSFYGDNHIELISFHGLKF